MKILYCATVDSHIKSFHLPVIHLLKIGGNKVDVVANGTYTNDDINHKYNLPFDKNPFGYSNLKCYFKLKQIAKENKYDLVVTHTPICSFLIRFALRGNKNCKVVYMAHGFHFYRNGNNDLEGKLYYNLEKCASKFTDVIITINEEDFSNAIKFKMKQGGKVYKTGGVGIDVNKFINTTVDYRIKRKTLGVEEQDYVILSVGELNKNKNHLTIIDKLYREGYFQKYPNLKYIICGEGINREDYEQYIKQSSLGDKVLLLGFRTDINEILKLSNLFLFPSLREGLPSSIIEAMASGLPILCSNIRGNRDLVIEQENGLLYDRYDMEQFCNKLNLFLENKIDVERMSCENQKQSKLYNANDLSKILVDIFYEVVGM